MYKIAIITSGAKPVPDVKGGAVEHLTTLLIKQNEKNSREKNNIFSLDNDMICFFDVYSLADVMLDDIRYKNTIIIQSKNHQKILPIRVLFSFINRFCNAMHLKKHFDYMSWILPKRVIYEIKKKCKTYDMILVENNLKIFFSLKRKLPDVKIIFHLHNDFDTIDIDYDKTAERMIKLGNEAVSVWAASYYLQKHLKMLNFKAPVEVLENCIEKSWYQKNNEKKVEKFLSKNGIASDDFVLLFSGRLDRWKGALQILQAVELLQNKKIKLLIVGGQWFGSREEQRYMQELNKVKKRIKDRVIFCGYVPHNEMQIVYQAADVVIIPSQCVEAFGMTALEAITMGKPCIASACGGLLNILDSSCAVLIEQGEGYVKKLSDIIGELYDNPKLIKFMAANARKKAEKFSDEREYYERFMELLTKI